MKKIHDARVPIPIATVMAIARRVKPIIMAWGRKPAVKNKRSKPGASQTPRKSRRRLPPPTNTAFRADLEGSLLALIRRTSCDLPSDVEAVIKRVLSREARGSSGRGFLEMILANIDMARREQAPLCQDTGTLIFQVQLPMGSDMHRITMAIHAAVAQASRQGFLRQNTVDSVTGRIYPVNLAEGAPVIHFLHAARDTLDIRLLMKGGGSENVSAQYSLPDNTLGAGRDLEGVRRCILDTLVQAQGNGCAPGFLGVCIGGDRATGYAHSKEQFFRKVEDQNPQRVLAALEEQVLREGNALGIGPMGLGGRATLLGVKIGSLSRVPASYFVTISYMCWAFRRRGILIDERGGIKRWLY